MKIFKFIIITLSLAIISCRADSKKSFPSVAFLTPLAPEKWLNCFV